MRMLPAILGLTTVFTLGFAERGSLTLEKLKKCFWRISSIGRKIVSMIF